MLSDDDEKKPKGGKDGYFFTKGQIIVAAIVVVVIIVVVGVGAGFAGRATASHGQTQSTGKPSDKPTQKMTPKYTKKPTEPVTNKPVPTTTKPMATTQKMTHKPTNPPPTPFTGSKAVMNNIRLPGNVEPVHYNFHLDIDVLGRKFSGNNVAQFNLVKQTDILLIHKKMMKLTATPVLSTDASFASDKTIALKEVGYYQKYEYLYMMVDTPLALGTYYLKLEFEANLTQSLFGIYLSQYRQFDGQQVWMVGSQCEPTEARRILPLFDEPALKATFNASITVDSRYIALWNMPSTGNTSLANGKVNFRYEKSVKMSTYLLAFVISEYGYIEQQTTRGTTMRIWAPKDRVHYGAWALQAGINMTEYMEKIFAIDYPLSKQDMISITDFNFGAMENWGLIIYVERAILFNEAEDTDRFKEIIARIVSHELAHQWFGNLVTFHWWNNVWINEGFATFYEYYGTANFMPTWDMMEAFLVRELQPGLGRDASQLSHPMEVHHFPSQNMILDYFTSVSYNKGGSVLRMLRNMLGNNQFDTAIRLYLQQNQWKEAYPHSLWSALQTAAPSQYNISAIASTWIRQMGHPIVTIARDPSNSNKGIFTQQRYLSNMTLDPNSEHPASPHKSPYGYKWNIPINWFFTNNVGANNFAVINMKDAQTSFDWPAGTTVKANTHQFGFFRVNYPEDNWNALATLIQDNPMALDVRDISNLIDDSMTFAEAGRLNFTTALAFTKYLVNETRYLPWITAIGKLAPIVDRLESSGKFGYFAGYYKQQLMPLIKKLQFQESGDHLERLLRVAVMDVACRMNEYHCMKNASEMFWNKVMNKTQDGIPASLRRIVYSAAVASGDDYSFFMLWNKLNTTFKSTIRPDILRALARSRQPWLLKAYLYMALHSDNLSYGEKASVFDYVAANPVGRLIPWEYIKTNFKMLYGYSKNNSVMSTFGRMIVNSVRRFDTIPKYKEMEMFFTKHPEFASYKSSVLTSIHTNIKWMKMRAMEIVKFSKYNTHYDNM